MQEKKKPGSGGAIWLVSVVTPEGLEPSTH